LSRPKLYKKVVEPHKKRGTVRLAYEISGMARKYIGFVRNCL